jgi:hypothetical protein
MPGLLERLGLRRKKTPQPPPGPKDPHAAAAIAVEVRDLRLIADREGITLKGTFAARSKAILQTSDRDEYVQAKQDLKTLTEDVKTEKTQKEGYTSAYAGVADKVNALPAPDAAPEPLKADRQEIATIDTERATAVAPATQDYAAAKAAVETLKTKVTAFETNLKTFNTKKADYDKYAAAYKGLPERIAKLPAAGTAEPLKTKREEVDAADKTRADLVKSDVQDYVGALAAVGTLKTKIDACSKVAINALLTKDPPDKDAIKALVKSGEGKVLDGIVSELGETPANRKIIQAAFEARFGVKFIMAHEGDTEAAKLEGNKSIARMYELMSKLPEEHTIGNKKFKQFQRDAGPGCVNKYTKVTVGTKTGGTKIVGKVMVQAGLPGNVSSMYAIGDPGELPGVEKAWLNEGFQKPSYFDWQTLHETGHAVDDGKGIMTKIKGTTLGGEWTEYASTDLVAVEVNKTFKYDLDYVKKKLKKQAAPPVACPTQGKETEWTQAQGNVDTFVNAVLNTSNIWDNGAVSSGAASVGGYTYHSPYGSSWVRYKTAERSKGVTGYQFRAPGEWFSELYAAYWSGILKDSHPIVPTLEENGKRS